jgi:membrane protein implicated in regulation of membrane protease activity
VVIFATIFGAGFVILILNLIFGHDVDHDFAHDGDIGGGDVDHNGHGPSILSIRMVSLAMVGFGAVGFGVRATTEAGMLTSSLAGIGGALGVGAIGYIIIRAFYASQASSTISDQDIIGSTGTLIDGVAEGGYGQVACVIRGREITYMARSKDGKQVDRGTPVRITGKTGSTVTVERVE